MMVNFKHHLTGLRGAQLAGKIKPVRVFLGEISI